MIPDPFAGFGLQAPPRKSRSGVTLQFCPPALDARLRSAHTGRMPSEQSYPTEPFEIFLEYDDDTPISTDRMADARKLAIWIKSEIPLAEHRIAGVDYGYGKVTILLPRQPIDRAVVGDLKLVIQKWMKQRGHRKVRASVEGVEEEIPFPTW